MRRALIIEDEKAMQQRISGLLKQIRGLAFDCAYTSNEAEGLIARHRYDVALVDIELGDKISEKFDGLPLARDLAKAGCATIIVSGESDTTVRQIARKLTGSEFINKPFEDYEIVAAVEQALDWADKLDNQDTSELFSDDLIIDPNNHRSILWKGKQVNLTPIQLTIVSMLSRAKGASVSRKELVKALKSGRGDAVSTHISNVRTRFKDVDSEFDRIEGKGGGYVWRQ